MDLISIVLALAIIGVILYFILQLPMPEIFKQGITVLIVIVVLLWLIRQLDLPNVL